MCQPFILPISSLGQPSFKLPLDCSEKNFFGPIFLTTFSFQKFCQSYSSHSLRKCHRFKNIGDLRLESVQFESHYSGQQRLDLHMEHVTRWIKVFYYFFIFHLLFFYQHPHGTCHEVGFTNTCQHSLLDWANICSSGEFQQNLNFFSRVLLEDLRVEEALQLTAKKVKKCDWIEKK